MKTKALRLRTPPDDVNAVHDFFEDIVRGAKLAPMQRFGFETALIELASNVIRYAGRGRPITCILTIEVSEAHISAELVDDGEPSEVPLDKEMPGDFADSGRGIALIRVLVDTFDYTRDDELNRWLIVKKLES